LEESDRDLILRNCFGIRLEGLRKTIKISVRIAGLRDEMKGSDNLEDLDIDGRVTLKYTGILKKKDVMLRTELI
jgi:hypothetical protein